MKSKYLVDITTFELPPVDAEITTFIEKQEVYWGDDFYKIGIMHNGVIYREILCEEGLIELISFHNFIGDHGYTDLVGDKGHIKSYSSLFVRNSDIR
ncbi:hypothetical protein [Avibacterium avium]|uniref:hypothetical protein n=1 Tax=Avibacterium avium TaxID=751 RepID=UPI003BF8CC80